MAMVWPWRKTKDEKFIVVFVPRHHHDWKMKHLFYTLPLRACHACCPSDVFHSFVPQSLKTHFTTCACTVCGRLIFLRAGQRWRPCPIVRARLFPRQLRPHPPHAGSGSLADARVGWRMSIAYASVGLHLLSAAGKFISLNEAHHVPCIIFLKPKCAVSLVKLKTFCAAHLPFKKTWPPLLRENFYRKCQSGWSGPATLAKKVLAVDRAVEILFLSRWHVRLRGLAERSVGRNTSSVAQIFYRSPCALACVGRAAILHNVLMQPAAKKL
jgi:hypothetical protein